MLINNSRICNRFSGLKIVYSTTSVSIAQIRINLASKFTNFTSLNRFFSILTSCAVFGLISSKPSIAAVMYSVTNIGTLGGEFSTAYDINDNGQVVGYAATSTSGGRAFLWDSTSGIRNLDPNGIYDSSAYSINNNGFVVGSTLKGGYNGGTAFLWDSVNGLQNLGTLPGDSFSNANAINDFGQVVGRSLDSSNRMQAFLWDSVNGIQSLGTLDGYEGSTALDINNDGEVVGYAFIPSRRAVLWDSTKGIQDLDPEGVYSDAQSINDAGTVVGTSTVGGDSASLWDSTKGIQYLGNLSGVYGSIASDINDLGQVVGSTIFPPRALLWENGTVTDLNTLIDPNSGWRLQYARAINNKGQIVGEGTNSTERYFGAFLLTPLTQIPKSIPEPTSGLGLLGAILSSIYLLKRNVSIR